MVAAKQIAPSQHIVTKSVPSDMFHNSGAPPEKEWRNPKRGEAKTERLNNSPERFVKKHSSFSYPEKFVTYVHPFFTSVSLTLFSLAVRFMLTKPTHLSKLLCQR